MNINELKKDVEERNLIIKELCELHLQTVKLRG